MFCHPFGLLSYSGIKSYQNLLVDVYGGTSTWGARNVFVQMTPLSFAMSGHYYWLYGGIDYQAMRSLFWTQAYASYTDAYYRYVTDTYFSTYSIAKAEGMSLRCLVR